MNTMTNWFRAMFGRFLAFGLASTAREAGARLGADVLSAQSALASEAAATLDAADSLKDRDDEIRKEVADLLSRGVADTVRTYQRFANFELGEDEAREALVSSPFSIGSAPVASLLRPEAEEQKAVEGPGAREGEPAKKRGPGRPKGSKNKPRNPG